MTSGGITAGPPVRVGYVQAGVPVVVDGERAGSPVVVTGGQQSVETLTNVRAQNAPTDSVLVKDADGVWRPRGHAPMRGAAVTMTDAPPPAADAEPGDIHFVYSEDGVIAVYQAEEI